VNTKEKPKNLGSSAENTEEFDLLRATRLHPGTGARGQCALARSAGASVVSVVAKALGFSTLAA